MNGTVIANMGEMLDQMVTAFLVILAIAATVMFIIGFFIGRYGMRHQAQPGRRGFPVVLHRTTPDITSTTPSAENRSPPYAPRARKNNGGRDSLRPPRWSLSK